MHSGQAGPKRSTVLTILVLGVCALKYWKTNFLLPTQGLPNPSDFHVYWHAAKGIVHGISPYEDPAFFYPPSVAFLMTPLAFVGYVTARWSWFLVSQLMMIGSGWLVWRALDRSRLALCCIAFVWAFGGALKETLDVGQLSPLLVLALAAAYTSRSRLRGAAIGLGFALKYIPGLLAVALLLHRGRRALAAFAGVSALALLLPWGAVVCFFQGAKAPVSAGYWMGTPSIFSWSIPSVVLRLLTGLQRGNLLPHDWEFGNEAVSLHLATRLQWISVGAALVTLAAGILVLAVRCRGRLTGRQLPWAMAALVSLSLAAAPVCWSHYQVLQYPGVALLLFRSISLRAWRTTAAVVSCFLLLHVLPEAALIRYHDLYGGWTAVSPLTVYFWTSIVPLSCLALFGLAVQQITPPATRAIHLVLADRAETQVPAATRSELIDLAR